MAKREAEGARRKPALKLEDLGSVLTVDEAANVLRIGRNRCYELIREGRLRVVTVGRRILVPRVSVERFLEGDTVPGDDLLLPPARNGRLLLEPRTAKDRRAFDR